MPVQVLGGMIVGWTVNVMLVGAFSVAFRSVFAVVLCLGLSIVLALLIISRRRSPFAWAYLFATICFLILNGAMIIGTALDDQVDHLG